MRFLIGLVLVLIIFLENPFSYDGYRPQTGDLLFQNLDCGPLCDAIEREHNGDGKNAFSHVGMLVWCGLRPYVIEAYGRVKLTPLSDFLSRSVDDYGNSKVLVERPKESYRQDLLLLKQLALTYLGKPYDSVFSMNNEAYYCSELMYDIYTKASHDSSYFKLSPMLFSGSKTGDVDSVWIAYFKAMNMKIPVGQLGCNPTQMSQSEKLELVHDFSQN